MFIVFAENGARKVGGQPCHVWRGIPSLKEVMVRVGVVRVHGMQIEVSDLGLPHKQANTYAGSGETFGSYDGRTLTVSCSLYSGSTIDSDVRTTMLRSAYDGVCRLYFNIFHGLAEGERKTTAAPPAGDTGTEAR